jgi:hypothetical protein
MSYDDNPFAAADADRHAIWEFLVRRDIDAYLAHDWASVEGDFLPDQFFAINANAAANPDRWTLGFPTLAAYRDSWLAGTIDQAEFAEELRPAMFRCTSLTAIEISGDGALAHKKFDGAIARRSGDPMILKWQSLYYLRRVAGRWHIIGFTGYLPNPVAG